MRKLTITALCVLLLSAFLVGCGNAEEKSRQAAFIDAVKAGVTEWNDQAESAGSGSDEYGASLLKGVQAEADAIKDIDVDAFEDKDFAKLASDYRDAVDEEIKGVENFPDDADSYNDGYVMGRAIIADVVSELVDKYGLKFDDTQILENVKKPAGRMLRTGEKETVETTDGDIQIAAEGVVVDQNSTDRARQFDGFTSSQNYSYLLCTLTNESVEPKHSSLDNWLNIGSMVMARGADGVDLTSPNFSYEYPGYEIATGGYYAIPAVGSTKRVAIPYVTEAGITELKIFVGDSFLYIKF